GRSNAAVSVVEVAETVRRSSRSDRKSATSRLTPSAIARNSSAETRRGGITASLSQGPRPRQRHVPAARLEPAGNFRYAGAYTESESGASYLINRYYDPATAGFLTVVRSSAPRMSLMAMRSRTRSTAQIQTVERGRGRAARARARRPRGSLLRSGGRGCAARAGLRVRPRLLRVSGAGDCSARAAFRPEACAVL